MTAPAVWSIPSASRPGLAHQVTLHADGLLTCTCTAAHFGRMCRHRLSVIRDHLQEMTMPFDPKPYFLRLKGKDYLPVAARLAWLREEHPDAAVVTKLLEHEQGAYALFRAAITIPSGGSATGWGSETVEDFGDYLEKAETKSLGRALAALGYGTLHALELDEGDSVADSPVERRTPVATPPPTPVDPELEQAKAGLVAAMQAEKWSLQRVLETASYIWPDVQTKADLGTLSAIQLTRLAEVVTGQSIIHLDTHGVRRIMPAAEAIGVAS